MYNNYNNNGNKKYSKSETNETSSSNRESFVSGFNTDTDNENEYNNENDNENDNEKPHRYSSKEKKMLKRMSTKDSATNGYKPSSYKDGSRGGKSDRDSLDKFFEEGNPLDGDNSSFKPSNDGDGNYAPYVSGSKKRSKTDEDMFNSGEFLPKETNNDWFEDVHAVSVKNRHMINVYRPIGVDTVSSTLKNPSLDIRGAPSNPKTFVSPFLNSSIEPDLNIRGLC